MKKLNKHFSHPHGLELIQLVKKEENDDDDDYIICSGCEQEISSNEPDYYTCPKHDSCEFILHKSCFELHKTIDHKSHPDHKLTFLTVPPKHNYYYDCNACGSLINAFSFHCEKSCDFKLHVKCAFLPETVDCKAHDRHALAIHHYTPKSSNENESDMFLCGVCGGSVPEECWYYFCKDCDFFTHLDCAFSAEATLPEEEEEEEEEGLSDATKKLRAKMKKSSDSNKALMMANIKAMDQMSKLQFQMQMTQINAFVRRTC